MVLFAVPGSALGFFGIDFVKPFTITILLQHRGSSASAMSTEFTPIFLFLLVAVAIALSMMIASAVLGPHKLTKVKQMPYESGMNPFGDARQRFDVRYYLIAIVFLLFDVELLFLYPWAVAQWSGGVPAATPGAGWKHGGPGGHSRGIPFPGLLGNPALHRDPGGGAGVRVEEGGLRMALGSSDRTRALRAGGLAAPVPT